MPRVRPTLLSTCASILVLIAVYAHRLVALESTGRPNILLILADDLGYADVDWRDRRLLTPHLRSLASSQHTTYLTNSYVMQRCTPTRSALMTGHYPFRTGTQSGVFVQADASGVPPQFTFLPEELRRRGYSTHLVGKWHLGYCRREFLPTTRGFDTFYGYYGPQAGYFNHSADILDHASGVLLRGLDLFREHGAESEADFSQIHRYSTDLFADETIRVLDERAVDKRPFFLFLSFQSVHAPMQAKPEDIQRCNRHYAFHPPNRLLYCAMLLSMDDAIGRVVRHLTQLGLYDNTVIVFSSDNGGDPQYGASNMPLRGAKNSLWEGGTKTNTFFHAPRFIHQFSYLTELFHVVDMYATLLNVATVPPSEGESSVENYGDGINQWPSIRGLPDKQHYRRSDLVYNIDTYSSGIRKLDYKLIYETDIPQLLAGHKGRARLYRLSDDPYERRDIAHSHPLLVRHLIDRILLYQREALPSVKTAIDMRGNPDRHGGSYAGGWC